MATGKKVGDAYVELTVEDQNFDVTIKSKAERAAKSLDQEITTGATNAASAIDSKLGGTDTFAGVERKAGSAADEMIAEFKRSTTKMREDIERLGDGVDMSPGFGPAGDEAGGAFLGAFAGVMSGDALTSIADIGVDVFTQAWENAMADADLEAGLQAALGLTEQQAEIAGQAAANVWANGWGESRETTAKAVEAVLAEFDKLTPDELEKITTQAIVMSEVFGVDVAQTAAAAGLAYRNGLAPDALTAMDMIAAGMQQMPVQFRDELLEASNEYGQFFAALGIDGDEAFQLLATAAEGGIYGIDKTGDAIKELTIRATDMSTGSAEAFEAAGLNADTMFDKFLAGGDVAGEAFDETVAGLLSIKDPSEQAQAAIALFGTPLEDLGTSEIPDFLRSLQTMDSGLTTTRGTAQEMVDTMGGTMSAEIETFRRQALQGLADMVTNYLIPAIQSFVAWVQSDFVPLISGVYQAWQPLIDGIVSMLIGFVEAGVEIFQILVDAIQLILAILSGDWGRAWEEIVSIFYNAWDLILAMLGIVIDPILGFVKQIIGFFEYLFDVLVGNSIIPDMVNKIVEWFVKMPGRIVGAITNFVRWMIDKFWDLSNSIIDNIYRFALWVINKYYDMGMTIRDVIYSFAAWMVNKFWDLVNTVQSAIFSFALWMINKFWEMTADIQGRVSGWISTLIGWFSSLPGQAAGALSSIASLVTGKFIDMASSAASKVVEWVGYVVSYIGELPGKAAGALSGLAGQILGKFASMAGSVAISVTGWVADVVSLVAGLPGKMANALAGMATTVGTSVRSAMKKGVNSAIDSLNNFLPNSVGFGPVSISLPANPIPRWNAIGGIFTRPTMRPEGFGEAGAEAVIPMTMPGRAMQLMHESGLGAMWDQRGPNRSGGGGDVHINIGTYHAGSQVSLDRLAQTITTARIAA